MSIEATVVCDGCGTVLAGGRPAADARRDVRNVGGKTSLPGGKDLCRNCLSEGRKPG